MDIFALFLFVSSAEGAFVTTQKVKNAKRRENLKKSFHSMGVDTIEIKTDGSLAEPIIQYFKIREKRR